MKLKLIFFLIPALLLFISCDRQEEVKTLRLAHGLDTRHPVHKTMEILGERLEEKSEGSLKLQVYPSGQLGGEREALELLQIGSLDITKVSAAVLENFIPEYKVFSMPYLFKNKQHLFNVLDGQVGEDLLMRGDKFHLRGLTFYDAGTRNFYTTETAIRKPQDLEDLKIRVMKSNMAVRMINELDGAPTPISWGELYTALQQGVVDGAENNLPSFYTSKHYEISKYLSMDEHTAIPDVLLISLETWNLLGKQERKWLIEAAEESKVEQRKLWAASEKESLKAVKAAGVEVIYPDKTAFSTETEDMIEMFEGQPELINIIERIKKVPE
ncbi:tripartite ATP-independent transporter solute receptor, DctP family [Salegentibacter echinorum]|uniref:Tripartite ATP-independent transporter solute receptor, DctP family n=1 Tax=Salegentibacter echinorum TaxID=1073325 RepID=A0A1M5HGV8_SALEC|nr:TRAP transporter substrate-binding protein [Salegentibacter echinorum]SHG15185.1 tripartite ATP-independent transporter solute receptor, DctP family [Salegentibacter echinorum]